MVNKLFLYLVLALALAFSVSAVGGINIAESTVVMTGNPGAINSSQYFTVHNIGSGALNGIVINSTDLNGLGGTISKSAMTFVPSVMDLAAGANAPSAIVLTIPADQRAGTYTGSAYAVYNITNQDSVTLSVTVRAVPSFTASGTTPSIVQGTSGTLTVNVTNTGNSDITGMMYRLTDPFTSGINLLDVTSSSVGTLSIPYGSSNSFTVSFNPPGSQPVGTYSGHVNLSYSGVELTVPLTVNVETINRQATGSATNAGVVMNRALGTVHSTSAGSLTVTNTGNYPLSGVTIYSSDLTGPSTISSSNIMVSENGFSMSVGQVKNIYLTPVGLSGALASGTYSGNLVVSYGGTSNLTVPFSVVVSDARASITPAEIVYPESIRNENVSTTVTITNTGDFTLTGITLAVSAPDTWMTGSVPGSLAVGGSFSVTLTSTVPEDAGSGPYKIGTLNFHSNEYSKNMDIKTNAEAMLVFDSVKVSIDDGGWDSVNDGGKAGDEARPGSRFAVKVKMENLFDDNDGLDMDDVEITALFHDAGEGGDDIDGESDSFDIDAGDKSIEMEIEFDDDVIDWEADAGDLLMELWAEGEDEEGGMHRAHFNFTIEVKRESKGDFIFTRLDAPSTVQCGRSFVLYVDGRSVGEDSDKEVVLEVENSALGIAIKQVFEMGKFDDDDGCNALDGDDDCSVFEFARTIQIPSNMATGSYTLEAKLYRDDGSKQTDEDDMEIRVECGTSSSSSTSSSSTTSTSSTTTSSTTTAASVRPSTTTSTSQTSASGSTPSTTTSSVEVLYGSGQGAGTARGVVASMPTKLTDTTKKEGFTESSGYLALLSVLSIVVIVGIIVLLIYAFTKPAE
ncbi:hypothetical protein KY359_05785 [Candidatus Woesearchaeota archaeon]|nr:hypothetical protein [Candidatus Woesearchaeota archaeon]